MTKRSGLMVMGLAVALAAALVFGGLVPALAQDGDDDTPDSWFPCPMWGDVDDLPDDMPYGPGMMWNYYNGEDLPEGWDELPRGMGPGMMWGLDPDAMPEEWADWYENMPETLPDGWQELPHGPGMMWNYYNGEDLPEGYDELPFGPGMMWGLDAGEMPEEWAEWVENCPMWNSDSSFNGMWGGRGMMGGHRGMMGGRGMRR